MRRIEQVRRCAGPALLSLLFCLVVSVPAVVDAQQDAPSANDPIAVPNPATELWRNVRDRESAETNDPGVRKIPPQMLARDLWQEVAAAQRDIAGSTQVEGPDAGVLINTQGEQWRNFRITQLVPLAGYLLGGVLVAIVLFRLVRGKIRLKAGRSDQRIKRFSVVQRSVHWTVAITFVILGLTGCVLLFGRFVLIPLFGNEAFSYLAIASKRIHDFVGPVFGVALLLQFFLFVRGNGPRLKEDIMWVLKGGGLLGAHASSHRYNAGEKSWFWLAMLGGAVVVASGLLLDFPIFGQDRAMMTFAHVVHSVAAVLILAASFGHIYMGTVAMEGAFEVMATGYCDANWAHEHHDLWYEEVASTAEPYPAGTGEAPVANPGSEQARSSA